MSIGIVILREKEQTTTTKHFKKRPSLESIQKVKLTINILVVWPCQIHSTLTTSNFLSIQAFQSG